MSTYAYAVPSAARVRASFLTVACRTLFVCLIYVPVLFCGWLYLVTTLPLHFISPEWYYGILRLGRKIFTSTLIITFSLLSNTNFVFSVSGPDGRLLQRSEFAELDEQGRLLHLVLPQKSVWIANHQIYTDWVYMWLLSWDAQVDKHLYIVLKKSLEKVPLAGSAMRIFGFIFLSRNWAEDSETMTLALHQVNQQSPKELALVIFPEGTNMSARSAQAAREYAARAGVICPRHTLLPRSKGLRFCLSKLYEDDKNISLLDFTIAYEGVDQQGLASECYTIRSQLLHGISPPKVHVHCNVIPLSEKCSPPQAPTKRLAELISRTDEESEKEFHDWLQNLWYEKDALIQRFQQDGDFVHGQTRQPRALTRRSSDSQNYLTWPIRPRSVMQETICFFGWIIGPLMVYIYLLLIRNMYMLTSRAFLWGS